MTRFRIVSWNIERGLKLLGVGDMLCALKADLVLLTEVDRGVARSGKRDGFTELESRLGMSGRFAREFYELESVWRSLVPIGGPGGGEHGNVVFSRHPILDYEVVPLPTQAPLSWQGHTLIPELFEPRIGRRVAQRFQVVIGERVVKVINTHLENWRCGWTLRRQQLCTAFRGFFEPAETGSLDAFSPADGAVASDQAEDGPEEEAWILAGDLNCLGGITQTLLQRGAIPEEVHRLRAFLALYGLEDPFANDETTCHPFGMRAKLDWIASRGLTVKARQLYRNDLSDHACLVVDYEL